MKRDPRKDRLAWRICWRWSSRRAAIRSMRDPPSFPTIARIGLEIRKSHREREREREREVLIPSKDSFLSSFFSPTDCRTSGTISILLAQLQILSSITYTRAAVISRGRTNSRIFVASTPLRSRRWLGILMMSHDVPHQRHHS